MQFEALSSIEKDLKRALMAVNHASENVDVVLDQGSTMMGNKVSFIYDDTFTIKQNITSLIKKIKKLGL